MAKTKTIDAGQVAIMPKGAWDGTVTYNFLDEVLYAHDSWYSVKGNNVGHTPADNSEWWRRGTSGGSYAKTVADQAAQDAQQAVQTATGNMEQAVQTAVGQANSARDAANAAANEWTKEGGLEDQVEKAVADAGAAEQLAIEAAASVETELSKLTGDLYPRFHVDTETMELKVVHVDQQNRFTLSDGVLHVNV